jgi:membrane fusion protein (multidrug efflux system)
MMHTRSNSTRLLALLFCIFLLTGCGSDEQKSKQTRPVVALKAYSITINDRIEALGTAGASESADITARSTGKLDSVAFTDGQKVNKGDIIVRLDQGEEQGQLAAARAQLSEHKREIARLEQLLEKRAASVRDLDTRKTQAAIAAANVAEIEARIEDLTIRAPFSGNIGIRRVSPGALVQPGQIITTLDATDPIKLDFTIPATQLKGLAAGTSITAQPDSRPDLTFHGTISALDSHIDPATRSILARAEIANPDGALIPGMLMRVTIMQNERTAVIVPEESVIQKEEKHFLTLIDGEGKAAIRAVTVGSRHDGIVEIREGLEAGEFVIVRGMGFVRSGESVTASETWTTIKDSQF